LKINVALRAVRAYFASVARNKGASNTMRTTLVYQEIAAMLTAIANCERANNAEWKAKHKQTLAAIMRDTAPSGSGIDCGTKILADSTPDKLIFFVEYHHMNESGMYDGWTEHRITVTPSLQFGFNLKISGRDRNGIKEYLGDVYHAWLSEEYARPQA
jgi:hypothetical protein